MDLESCPKFEPQQRDYTILQNFASTREDKVQTIICSMLSKTCELDVLPIKVLKQVIGAVIKHITLIISKSL